MADQPNIFDDAPESIAPDASQEVVQKQQTTEVNAQYAHLLDGIKNERGEKKYDSLPEALKGLAHAQQYIPELKSQLSAKDQELERLRVELAKRESAEEIVSRLSAKNQPQEQGTPPAASGLDVGTVEQLVEQLLVRKSRESEAQMNLRQVETVLVEKFGDKARDVIKQQMQETGLSSEDFKAWAAKSPKAVLKLFNAAPAATPKATTSSVNIPLTRTEPEPLKAPSKSLLAGATSREQSDFMAEVKRRVYERHGITQ